MILVSIFEGNILPEYPVVIKRRPRFSCHFNPTVRCFLHATVSSRWSFALTTSLEICFLFNRNVPYNVVLLCEAYMAVEHLCNYCKSIAYDFYLEMCPVKSFQRFLRDLIQALNPSYHNTEAHSLCNRLVHKTCRMIHRICAVFPEYIDGKQNVLTTKLLTYQLKNLYFVYYFFFRKLCRRAVQISCNLCNLYPLASSLLLKYPKLQ